jgi:hypothetical protein
VWLALTVVFVVVGIGTPLLGLRAFHGAALVAQAYPWKADAPVAAIDARYMPVNDTVEGTAPSRELFADGVRAGDVRLWNPYVAGGKPLGAVPGSGLWTPWMAPFLVLPAWAAHGYLELFALAVAGGTTFLFLRRLRLSRPACLAGALCAMSAGFLVAWTNWAQSTTAALVPAVFWAADRALEKRTAAAHAVAALVFAWFVLSGFPAIVGYTMYVLVPYVALRAWWQRDRTTAWLGRGAAVGLALALGVALSAFALLPFREWLASLDLSYRDSGSGQVATWRGLLTLFAPFGYGSPVDGTYFGLRSTGGVHGAVGNIVEVQTFVGAAALVLVGAALALRPAVAHRRTLVFFAVALAGLGLALVGTDPLSAALRDLPIYASNRVGRSRAVIGFVLAVLVAHGVEAIGARRPPARGRDRLRVAVVAATGVGGAVALVAAAAVRASRVDEEGALVRALVVPGVATVAAVVGVVLAVRRPSLRAAASCALAVVVTVEALAFVRPFWPRTDPDEHYASTPTHEFLAAHLDGDRMAAGGVTMWPGTNAVYGLRTPTGHVFHDRRWVELLEAADPEVMRRPTVSILSDDLDVVLSPVLDRMAVRYFVVDPTRPVFGERREPPRAVGVVDAVAGRPVDAPLHPSTVRAIVLRAEPGSRLADVDAEIRVRVLDRDGRVVAAGRRRTFHGVAPGRVEIPVAGEPLAGPSPRRVEVELVSAVASDRVRLAATASGAPAVGAVAPADDRLRLVSSDGAAVYERLDALPRVRFAGRAVAASGAGAASDLARGVADDTVVLSAGDVGTPGRVPSSGSVDVLDDGTDTVRVRVRADGPGHVVVADAMQQGWVATLDGASTALLPADHAMVAVAVPAGEHVVALRYEPAGRDAGLLVSGGAATLVAGAFVVPVARRRARGRTSRAGATRRPYDG